MHTVHVPCVPMCCVGQVTGEAKYCDDEATPPGCLEAGLVLSTVPYGRIVSLDVAPALAVEGVIDVVLAKDVPGMCQHQHYTRLRQYGRKVFPSFPFSPPTFDHPPHWNHG
jgi:xanthine dehydrogenase molybdopterin-binding subunit B